MFRRASFITAVAVMALTVLTACGGGDNEAEPTATRIPATNAPVSTTPTSGAGTTASPAAQGSPNASPAAGGVGTPAVSAVGSAVAIEMLDIKYSLTEMTIPANTAVTINLSNKGAAKHNFNIDALDVHSGDYEPGQSGTITINAPPGEYEYYCSIPGHKAAGMVGKLIVQ
jgi:plastocyanin